MICGSTPCGHQASRPFSSRDEHRHWDTGQKPIVPLPAKKDTPTNNLDTDEFMKSRGAKIGVPPKTICGYKFQKKTYHIKVRIWSINTEWLWIETFWATAKEREAH